MADTTIWRTYAQIVGAGTYYGHDLAAGFLSLEKDRLIARHVSNEVLESYQYPLEPSCVLCRRSFRVMKPALLRWRTKFCSRACYEEAWNSYVQALALGRLDDFDAAISDGRLKEFCERYGESFL